MDIDWDKFIDAKGLREAEKQKKEFYGQIHDQFDQNLDKVKSLLQDLKKEEDEGDDYDGEHKIYMTIVNLLMFKVSALEVMVKDSREILRKNFDIMQTILSKE